MEDRGRFSQRTRQIIVVLAATWLAAISLAGEPIFDKKMKFDVPAMPYPKAILAYSHQANIEVLFIATDDLRKLITPPLKGEFSPREALERLVQGTGLIFRFDSDHSAVIRPPYPAGQDSMVELDIPAGPAAQTLREWSKQAGRQLLFDRNAVKRYRTEAIKGRFEPIDSLLRMTRGTELVATQTNDHTYSIAVARKSLNERLKDSLMRILPSSQTTDTEEVLIATSRFKGVDHLPGEPAVSLSRADMNAAGFDSVPEFLAALPQVWGGGPNEYSLIGREGQTNSTSGSGLNFHALGAESTLVLIDGVRPAGSGTEAGWWDDSLLPLSAIERVEIIPDGASLLYGSDAIGAVVNFVTRSNFSGAETQAQFSETTSGGVAARRFSQLLGQRWGDSDASIILEYYDRDAMSAAARAQATSDLRPWGATNWNSRNGYPGTLVTSSGQTWAITGVSNGKPVLGPEGSSNTYDRWQAREILPSQQRLSVMGHASMLLEDVRIWSNAWVSQRHSVLSFGDVSGGTVSLPSTNPGYVNPLGGTNPVYIQYGFWNLLGPQTSDESVLSASAAAGLIVEKLGWNFDLSAHTGLERDRVLQAGVGNLSAFQQALSAPDPLNPFAPASSADPTILAGLSRDERYHSWSRIKAVDASASRNLRSSSAGDPQFSIGAQYRQESFSSFNSLLGWQGADRRVRSVYADLDLPLIGTMQAVPLVRQLRASLGARYEGYSNDSALTSPFFSLEWSPVSMLTLRGTYRRGFRPPALTERLTGTNVSGIVKLSDGRTALVENGGNPGLRPEIARTWTAGFDFKPSERMQISATYYTVASSGRVFIPAFSPNLAVFDGVVVANPTAAQRGAICGESRFITGPQALCEQTPVQVFLDARLLSLERLTTSGIDALVQYASDEWKFRFDGTYLLSYLGISDGMILEQLNTLNNPVDLRVRASAARKMGPVTLTSSVSYTGSYGDISSQPHRRVGSRTTVDLAATYTPASTALLHGMEIEVGVHNLLDRTPPFANDGQATAGWDPANGGNLEDRVVSGQIRWNW